MTVTRPANPEIAGFAGLLLAACAVLLAPLLLVDVPPLLDYPNHLARAYVLAFASADPVLSQMYVSRWAVIPNLAVDLLLPPLLHVLPVHVAGRVLLGVALLLPVLGCVLYARAVSGRWQPWSVASCLVAANGLFLLGFLNLQLGLGLALLCAAGWAAWRERRPVACIAFGALAAPALFFAHMMGLAFFLLLVGGHELEQAWRHRTLVRRATAASPLLAGPLALYALSAFGAEPGAVQWETWHDKLVRAAMGFIAYDLPLDLAAAGAVATLLLACAATGRLAARPQAVLALFGATVLFAVSPFGLKGTGYLDARFAVMAAFMLFAGLVPRLPYRLGRITAIAVAAVFLLRTGQLAQDWHAHAADLIQLRAAIAHVAPGERVLPVVVDTAEADPAQADLLLRQTLADGTRLDVHTSALLLIERHAFWPALFARPEQQPVALRSPYRELARATGGLPTMAQLGGVPDPVFPLGSHAEQHYDAVLLIEGGAVAPPSRTDLVPVVRSGYASLFRVTAPR